MRVAGNDENEELNIEKHHLNCYVKGLRSVESLCPGAGGEGHEITKMGRIRLHFL